MSVYLRIPVQNIYILSQSRWSFLKIDPYFSYKTWVAVDSGECEDALIVSIARNKARGLPFTQVLENNT